jgi:hypothetical protein
VDGSTLAISWNSVMGAILALLGWTVRIILGDYRHWKDQTTREISGLRERLAYVEGRCGHCDLSQEPSIPD